LPWVFNRLIYDPDYMGDLKVDPVSLLLPNLNVLKEMAK
jgi:hypothetical protein